MWLNMACQLQKEKQCSELLEHLVWPQKRQAAIRSIVALGPDILVRTGKYPAWPLTRPQIHPDPSQNELVFQDTALWFLN